MLSLAAIAAFLSLSCTPVLALNSIAMQGADFIDSTTKDRFVIIGVDYQPGGQSAFGNGQDPLSDPTACLRDAALMQQLGVNTIRSYNVDPTLNHDQCVSIFNAVGIYMIIDVNSPLSGQSLDRSNPSGTYTASYMAHVFQVIDAFKNYPNTLGFFSGNEIINDVPSAKDNPQYIRAITRDMKNYIAKQSSRSIPVGYSAADVREVLQDTWAYLQCTLGSNDNSRSDFFGLNSYSWCGGQATFDTAGYNDLVTMFAKTTIPVFFSEYGCNKVMPRVFDEVQALYGTQMTTFSGGLVYEWSQEVSDYGLVNVNSDNSVKLLGDYNTLQTQYGKLNVTLLESSNSTAQQQTPPTCNSNLISDDGFATNFNIPKSPNQVSAMIASGVASATTGKIVSVTQTKVQVPVTNTAGALITGLAIREVTGANTPGAYKSSGGSAASSSSKTGGIGSVMTAAPAAIAAGALGIVAMAI